MHQLFEVPGRSKRLIKQRLSAEERRPMARSHAHTLDHHGHFITSETEEKDFLEKMLDLVERVGNKVPHPVVIFILLIGLVIVLSHIFYLTGATVTYQAVNPETDTIEDVTASARSLLTADGLRFMYSGVVQNFMNFTAVGVIIVEMLGVGVAVSAGVVDAQVRKLVEIAPPKALTYILVFIGIISSIAADAGYLVLVPLAAAAYLSVGRNPLAGLAASFAAVAAVFSVNIIV